MKSELVITTSTWYSEPCVRSRCAVNLVANCIARGIPIVVVDGGSFKKFREEIQDVGKDYLILLDEVAHPKGTLGPGRRQAIREGFTLTGGRLSGYCEAEKSDMPRFVEMLCQPILNRKTDLAIPRRSKRSLATYPTAQQFTESAGNLHWRQATGYNWDIFFGPRWFNTTAGKFFLEYDDQYGGTWDPVSIPALRCAAAGLRITTPELDYAHSAEQTAEEENSFVYTRKRFEQLMNLASGAEAEATALHLQG